jgi:hypothetical protein
MMAASGPGASHSFHYNASIIDVLLAYGARGGALYAAYRHPDNPLLLTHVRWQGPAGEMIETSRGPEDMAMVREEREAWAQVALRSTTLRPDAVGPNAPWLQAPLDPREAYDLATRAQRAREGANMTPTERLYQGVSSGSPARPLSHSTGTPPRLPAFGAPGGAPQIHAHGVSADANPGYDSFGSYGSGLSPASGGSQITGSWARDAFQSFQSVESQPDQEIIVITCIEIEMPSLMPGTPQDFTRDFARDVALNFNRAARTIPQTRETRGWMHGSRMTLGALMALGTGSRPASRIEMEHAADTLASALASRTLPYVRLRFAEMSEWAQGVPLPE